MTEKLTYRVVVSGDVPLQKKDTMQTFAFPKELTNSFEKLKEPLFSRLPALRQFKLQPLPLVLKHEHLVPNRILPVVGLAILICLGVIWWWSASRVRPPRVMPVVAAVPKAPVLNPYQQAISTAAPAQQLAKIAINMERFYHISGWQLTLLQWQHNRLQLQLTPVTGSFSLLAGWMRQHQYQYQFNAQGARVELNLQQKAVIRAPKLHHINQEIAVLVDQLNHIFYGRSMVLSNIQRIGPYRHADLTVQLKAIAPQFLVLLGQHLAGLPVVLNSMELHVSAGLFNGTIQLSVWGK